MLFDCFLSCVCFCLVSCICINLQALAVPVPNTSRARLRASAWIHNIDFSITNVGLKRTRASKAKVRVTYRKYPKGLPQGPFSAHVRVRSLELPFGLYIVLPAIPGTIYGGLDIAHRRRPCFAPLTMMDID